MRYLKSAVSLHLYCYYCALVAAEGFWTNTTTTASLAARTVPVNVKPPLPIGKSSSFASETKSAENNGFAAFSTSTTAGPSSSINGFTALATTTFSDGLATYGNVTFKSVCPQGDKACYDLCGTYADSCRADVWAWQRTDAAYQSSMNAKHYNGTSRVVSVSITTRPDWLSTYWSYQTSWLTSYLTYDLADIGAAGQAFYYPTTLTKTVDGKETTIVSTVTQSGIQTQTTRIAYATAAGKVVSVRTGKYYTEPVTEYYSWSNPEPTPSCAPRSWTDCQYSKDCNKCTISGGTVRLLYFPVTRTSSSNGTIKAPLTTAPLHTAPAASPETVLYENTTLTSGSVYISFHKAYANNECGQHVGSTYPGAILAMDPKSLRSINMRWGTMYSSALDAFRSSPYLIATSMNLEDLYWPYAESAYQNQPKCQNGPLQSCSVIVKDDFFPLLEVPDEIRNMDPAWKDCALDWEGLYDPPTVLKPAAAAAEPTLPSMPVSTTAEPQATITSPAKETAAPSTASTKTTESHNTAEAEPHDPAKSSSASAPDSAPEIVIIIPSGPKTTADVEGNSKSIAAAEGGDPTSVAGLRDSSSVSFKYSPDSTRSASDIEEAPISSRSRTQAPVTTTPLKAVIGSQTLTAGGAAHTISGEIVSLASSLIVFGSSTIDLPATTAGSDGKYTFVAGGKSATHANTSPNAAEYPARIVVTLVGGESYTVVQGSNSNEAVVGSLTMTVGGDPVSITNGAISLGSGGELMISEASGSTRIVKTVDAFGSGRTAAEPSASRHISSSLIRAPSHSLMSLASTVPRIVFTVGESTYTAVQTRGPEELVVGTRTLSVGDAALSLPQGTVSLASDGLELLAGDGHWDGPKTASTAGPSSNITTATSTEHSSTAASASSSCMNSISCASDPAEPASTESSATQTGRVGWYVAFALAAGVLYI